MTAVLLALALSASPSAMVTARDPIDGSRHDYRGMPLLALLPTSAIGDAVLVRCDDGFVALLPLATVRRYEPVVADEVRGAEGWEPVPTPRGPRFLVWPNVARPEIDRDPDVTSEGWAWAVASVEVVSRRDYLAPLTLQGGTSIQRGRALWLSSCFHCHAVHGAGGLAGWDLSEPVPLWQYLDEPQIARYLAAPRAVNPDGHMPVQNLSRRELRDLFAFLHAAVR